MRGLSTTAVRALAVDPVRPATVYVGTGTGVFRSVDGDCTWHTLDVGVAPHDVLSSAPLPRRRRLFAGTSGRGVVSHPLGG